MLSNVFSEGDLNWQVHSRTCIINNDISVKNLHRASLATPAVSHPLIGISVSCVGAQLACSSPN